MILKDKIISQLNDKLHLFNDFNFNVKSDLNSHHRALESLTSLSSQQILQEISSIPTPGAIPVPVEFDQGFLKKFPHRFSNHAESRSWAASILAGHPVLAADGSQIMPVRDYSVPIAAIQVAWFLNFHSSDGKYIKDQDLKILTPHDLTVDFDGDRRISEQEINLKRFEFETDALCNQMKPLGREALAFLDSSIVITFADKLQPELRNAYIKNVLKLLRAAKSSDTPLIGYIDTSYASDLINLIENCTKIPGSQKIHDAQLLSPLMEWGDRTAVFICARSSADRRKEGVLESFAEYSRAIGFTYLKTTAAAPPARLEFPMWIYEEGLLDSVLDLVRAEVIAGNGYPYAIETADAAAVITNSDRETFYTLFRHFAETRNLDLQISQKAASKHRRR